MVRSDEVRARNPDLLAVPYCARAFNAKSGKEVIEGSSVAPEGWSSETLGSPHGDHSVRRSVPLRLLLVPILPQGSGDRPQSCHGPLGYHRRHT